MANFGSWDKAMPSGSSQLRFGDDLMRSDKSVLEATLNTEHYFESGSAASAGIHRLGSARIYSGASSAVSSTGEDGRLMWDTTNTQLVALHAASTTRLPSLAVANTWAAAQTFSAAVTMASTLGVTGVATLSTVRITAASTAFANNANPTLFSSNQISGTAGDLVIQPATTAATDITFRTFNGTSTDNRLIIRSTGLVNIGNTVTTSASAGEMVLANAKSLRGVNAAGTDTQAMIQVDSSNQIILAPGASGVHIPVAALASMLAGSVGRNGRIAIDSTNNRLVVYANGARNYITFDGTA